MSMSYETVRSIKQTAFRDFTRAMLFLLVTTNLVTGYHYAKVALDDPKDFATYNGSYGPFAYREGMPIGLEAQTYGPTQTVFHAGDTVAYATLLCLSPTTTASGHAELVRVAQNGVGENIVDRHDVISSPSVHRCGPRVSAFHIPSDALPGSYEVRRWVDLDAGDSWVRRVWPLQMHFEPLVLQVVTTFYTAPSVVGQDSPQDR